MNNLLSYCKISFYFLIIISINLFIFSLKFMLNDLIIFIEWEIISLYSVSIVMTFLFDWMSLMFMSFVLLISSLVIFYSNDYMMSDVNINRFILLVLMFVFSMMMLIISPNLISILLGWDGLGLVSYCLVIYFQNVKSYNAGMLTGLSNRIGDVTLLLAITWMLNYGSWNYIFYLEMKSNNFEMFIIMGLVMLAAMTKSAQIPFSSWLPAAMAAPTPVSALVHSSTLVTAGVYLLIRFNILLINTFFGQFMLLISGLTMFMAGLGANFEFDLKKIIALSTLSQLGLMMSILSIGEFKLAFFHLLTHALFKALLFMCAGVIIHNMKNVQDIRFMGGLFMSMPMVCSCFNIANLALCGMPFLAGFYSKDMILEVVMLSYMNFFSFFLFFFSTGLTVCYSLRLVYYSMTGNFKNMSLNMLSDKSKIMNFSIFFLMIMTIFSGSMLNWLLFLNPKMIMLPKFMKLLTLIVCLLGGLIGYMLNYMFLLNSNIFVKYNLKLFVGMMWFMPLISTLFIIKFPLKLGLNLYKSFDQGWSEYFGGQMLYNQMKKYSLYIQEFQNNNLKIYLMSYFIWIIILLIMMFLN
uniref:NADH-ubiquinone oxidoreductase chain 5 n=1 Tax=Toxorhynchites speciosus TaxID=2681096 RepID=A0A7T0GDV5_9DIPT|nr:NADH dehydrogenase subunit 5 [Toxorhynchites speciosus]QPJ78650.1 NADH dehydrogenase subunit 5 [Toxorhynchites speciosus]